jgi:hypothetical protein
MESARGAEDSGESGMEILSLSRSSYYRQVRRMTDDKADRRPAESTQHAEVLCEVAFKGGGSGTPVSERAMP